MQRIIFYRFITIGCLAFGLISCAAKVQTEENVSKTNPAVLTEAIAKSDELFRQRADTARLREAVQTLGRTRNPDARNYEVEWKFAKYSYFLGRLTDDTKESEKAFEDGIQAGEIASKLQPDKPDGYFWYGANLGEQAQRSPLTSGLKAIDKIRSAMHKVIEIQPDYQNASAYDALAQVELKSGMIGGGTPEKAIEYLEKGLTIDKNNSYLYLHLAEAYLAVDRKADAKKQLEYLLKMQPQPDYLTEYKETADRAQELLKTRF